MHKVFPHSVYLIAEFEPTPGIEPVSVFFPAMDGGWIEPTQPDSPRSPTQRYRLSNKARRWLRELGNG